MIVDLDIRLWPRGDDLGDEIATALRGRAAARWVSPEASPESLDPALAAVDAGIVVGFESDLLRGGVSEEFLRPVVERSEGRLLLARAIDPTLPGAAERVESARAAGASAIWLDPMLQGFHPADSRAMRVFDRAEANQLPVLLGWSGPMPASARLEFGRPFLLDEVARAFPRLFLVVGGFGAPFVSETIALVAKHGRCFTHVGGIASRPWELLHALECARDHGVEDKILFASGFPFDLPARAIEAIYAVNASVVGTPLPRIARSALREIVERDAISLLGLGTPPKTRERTSNRVLASDAVLRLTGEAG